MQNKQDERLGLPSASEFPRIVGCTGYLNFKSEVGEIPENETEYSANGTQDHAIISLDGDGKENIKDDSRVWVIEQCISLRNKLIREIFIGAEYEEIREKRVWIIGEDKQRIFSGKPDHVVIDKTNGCALVIDYKTLPGDVDSSESNQQLSALVGCVSSLMERMGVTRNSIYAAIIQPSVTLEPTVVRYDTKDIHRATYSISYRLSNARSKLATKSPGAWCKYCPLAGRCAEAQSFSLTLFNGNIPEKIGQMTPEQIASIVSKVSVIENIFDSVKRRAVELAEAGMLPGYEMAPGREVTSVTDIQGFYNEVKDYITREELFSNLSLTKGPIEITFKDRYSKAIECTKRQAGIAFDEIVKKFGETKNQARRLVKLKVKQVK